MSDDMVAQPITGAFPIDTGGTVPMVGSQGVTTQFFCPLIKNNCMKHHCMFWVEMKNPSGLVGHCAYYWSAVMTTEIKDRLLELNAKVEGLMTRGATP